MQARPVHASQKKISRNLSVSYNLTVEVTLTFFGIASNQIILPTSHPSSNSIYSPKPSFFGG